MSFRQVTFYAGCAAAWFFLLPVFVVGGGIALLAYALCSEINEFFAGDAKQVVDSSTAREIARRVCLDTH